MALTALSTDADVWNAFDNNADYDLVVSTTKAQAFIQACRLLLRRRPTRHSSGGRDGTEVEFAAGAIGNALATVFFA